MHHVVRNGTLPLLLSLGSLLGTYSASADDKGYSRSEWYASWGYSRDYWQPSDIHISQPSLGNDFTVHQVKGSDYPLWDSGLLNRGITSPQWNLRVGRFVDAAKNYAIELNIDHSKYTSIANQSAHITGTINNQTVDMYHNLTNAYFRYCLHNGANHIMLNLVRRVPLYGGKNRTFSLAGVFKAGAGIMLPHSSNTILGNDNNVGAKTENNVVGTHSGWWQLNGWTTGVEAGVRWIPVMPIYLELTWKIAYASLRGIPVYQGTADQNLIMNEGILSLGYTFGGRP